MSSRAHRRHSTSVLGWGVAAPSLSATLVFAIGCGGGSNSPSKAESAGGGKSSTTIAASERRVASRVVLADELLWALGPEVHGRVVGLSPMADDARYSAVAEQWPEATPRLGRNPEELLAIAPDLVIVASFSDAEYRAAIDGKVEVLVLEGFDGFDDFRANLRTIGEAVGAEGAAEKVREAFDARVAKIEARRPALAEGEARPTIASWQSGYLAGLDTTFDDAAEAAGFRNVATKAGHLRVDAEQLVSWAPDWLVIGCGERACDEAVAALDEAPGIRTLEAVREGRVIAIEAPYLGSVGEGMLELAERLQAPLRASAEQGAKADEASPR